MAIVAVALPLVLFVALAVQAAMGDVAAWDRSLSERIHSYENRETFLDAWVNPLDLVLRPTVQVVGALAAAAVTIVLYRRGHRRLALFVAAGVAGATLLGPILKEIIDRPPMDPSGDGEGEIFPSGHALRSMAVAGALVVVAWPTRWRWPTLVVSAAVVALIGVAVVYHEWHWASDVLGGWLLAAAWLGLVWLAVRPRGERRARERPGHS